MLALDNGGGDSTWSSASRTRAGLVDSLWVEDVAAVGLLPGRGCLSRLPRRPLRVDVVTRRVDGELESLEASSFFPTMGLDFHFLVFVAGMAASCSLAFRGDAEPMWVKAKLSLPASMSDGARLVDEISSSLDTRLIMMGSVICNGQRGRTSQ